MELGLLQAVLPIALRVFQLAAALLACLSLWSGGSAWWVRAEDMARTSLLDSELPAPSPAPGRSHYAVIEQRNVFRSQTLPPEIEVRPEPIEKTSLDLSLVGTLAGESAAQSVAVVLGDRGAGTQIVGIGDRIAKGRARVVSIEQRRVVLDHDGKLESIEIDLSKPSAPSAPTRATRVAAGSALPLPSTPEGIRDAFSQSLLGRALEERDAAEAEAEAD